MDAIDPSTSSDENEENIIGTVNVHVNMHMAMERGPCWYRSNLSDSEESTTLSSRRGKTLVPVCPQVVMTQA